MSIYQSDKFQPGNSCRKSLNFGGRFPVSPITSPFAGIILVLWALLWPSFILSVRLMDNQSVDNILKYLVVIGVMSFFFQLIELFIGHTAPLLIIKCIGVWVLKAGDFRRARSLFGVLHDFVADRRSLAHFAEQANDSIFAALSSL
jgi:hypothetical protein